MNPESETSEMHLMTARLFGGVILMILAGAGLAALAIGFLWLGLPARTAGFPALLCIAAGEIGRRLYRSATVS
ncbi:MAG TPA: hypothetical protein VGE53_00645 [Candidatus Paceibacterota bacterium]